VIDLSRYSTGDFDRGASRLKEALWVLLRALFFGRALPVPSAVKVFWLRVFGAKIGKGAVIRSGVNISFPWRLQMGDHVWLGDEVTILSLAPVIIGSNVCLSQRAFICTGSHDYSKPGFDLCVRPVRVEDGSWVAAQCFVAPGVTIGRGSVAAAGSIVVQDVEAGTLVGGNPARFLKRVKGVD